MLNLKRFKNSFKNAFQGLVRAADEGQNFRIMLVTGAIVMVLMMLFDVHRLEKAVLTLAIALVLVLELMNSIFERVVDLLKPRMHLQVKEIKDIMAGGVLVASVGAALVGVIILGPYIWAWLKY
ncbi:MAG: diacylglycerol kinase family protein [Patescibacteria group bacterium]|nr:diacylglycerol kinase family protein [Patescibacteria group bacterium]